MQITSSLYGIFFDSKLHQNYASLHHSTVTFDTYCGNELNVTFLLSKALLKNRHFLHPFKSCTATFYVKLFPFLLKPEGICNIKESSWKIKLLNSFVNLRGNLGTSTMFACLCLNKHHPMKVQAVTDLVCAVRGPVCLYK